MVGAYCRSLVLVNPLSLLRGIRFLLGTARQLSLIVIRAQRLRAELVYQGTLPLWAPASPLHWRGHCTEMIAAPHSPLLHRIRVKRQATLVRTCKPRHDGERHKSSYLRPARGAKLTAIRTFSASGWLRERLRGCPHRGVPSCMRGIHDHPSSLPKPPIASAPLWLSDSNMISCVTDIREPVTRNY